MVDPDDELTDVRMPEQGTDGHVTLLVAEYLAGRAADGSDGAGSRADRDELAAFVRDAAAAHVVLAQGRHGAGGRRRAAGRRARKADGAAAGAEVLPDRRVAGASRDRALRRGRNRPSARRRKARELTAGTRSDVRALAAAARRARRPVLLRHRGVLVPRRPAAAARQQRHRQVEGARADAAVPAGRRAVPAPRRARRRPAEADGVEPAARRQASASRAARLHLAGVRPPSTRTATPEYRTLGCGLKAVTDRGIARHWFFVTDQRVGVDLALLSTRRRRR